MIRTQGDLQQAMQVYEELAEVIDPATAETIRYSFLKYNKTLLWIAVFGFLGFFLLIFLNVLNIQNDVATSLIGAILGSTLYAFWTARTYLRDSTFSKRYSQDYVVRFGIGVVSGFVLGSIMSEGILTGTGDKVQQFGPFTLAVVGGFSAEVVVQILNRIAEILLTSIRGSGKEQAMVAAEKSINRKLNDTASELNAALEQGELKDMQQRVREIVQNLLKE